MTVALRCEHCARQLIMIIDYDNTSVAIQEQCKCMNIIKKSVVLPIRVLYFNSTGGLFHVSDTKCNVVKIVNIVSIQG